MPARLLIPLYSLDNLCDGSAAPVGRINHIYCDSTVHIPFADKSLDQSPNMIAFAVDARAPPLLPFVESPRRLPVSDPVLVLVPQCVQIPGAL